MIHNENLILHQYQFQLYVHQAQIKLKFPCLFYLTWKTNTITTQKKNSISPVNNIINFNYNLHLKDQIAFSLQNDKFLPKKSIISIYLNSLLQPNQSKLVGIVTLDLSNCLNFHQMQNLNKYTIQRCPDRSSWISFFIKFKHLEKSKNISINEYYQYNNILNLGDQKSIISRFSELEKLKKQKNINISGKNNQSSENIMKNNNGKISGEYQNNIIDLEDINANKQLKTTESMRVMKNIIKNGTNKQQFNHETKTISKQLSQLQIRKDLNNFHNYLVRVPSKMKTQAEQYQYTKEIFPESANNLRLINEKQTNSIKKGQNSQNESQKSNKYSKQQSNYQIKYSTLKKSYEKLKLQNNILKLKITQLVYQLSEKEFFLNQIGSKIDNEEQKQQTLKQKYQISKLNNESIIENENARQKIKEEKLQQKQTNQKNKLLILNNTSKPQINKLEELIEYYKKQNSKKQNILTQIIKQRDMMNSENKCLSVRIEKFQEQIKRKNEEIEILTQKIQQIKFHKKQIKEIDNERISSIQQLNKIQKNTEIKNDFIINLQEILDNSNKNEVNLRKHLEILQSQILNLKKSMQLKQNYLQQYKLRQSQQNKEIEELYEQIQELKGKDFMKYHKKIIELLEKNNQVQNLSKLKLVNKNTQNKSIKLLNSQVLKNIIQLRTEVTKLKLYLLEIKKQNLEIKNLIQIFGKVQHIISSILINIYF